MYICLGLIEQITADGLLRSCRIAPADNQGAVVIDWLKEIHPDHVVSGAQDIGPFRFYDFDSCVVQSVECRPRGLHSNGDTIEFSFGHHSVPIPNGPAFYSLSPPPGYVFTDLDVDTFGAETQNRAAILDREKNLMTIAFEFWHPERRGSIEVRGRARRHGDLMPSDVSHLPDFTYYDFNEDALAFVNAMYWKKAKRIKTTVNEQAYGVPAPPDVRILFLAANPNQTSRLDLEEEIRAIEMELQAVKHRDQIMMTPCHAVRPDDLVRYVREHSPNVIHFSGHGSADGIILRNDTGGFQPVEGSALRRFFDDRGIDLVVLNACVSGGQAEEISSVVPVVVGTSGVVGDEAARRFSVAFYRGLGNGLKIADAFRDGGDSVALHGLGDVFVNHGELDTALTGFERVEAS